MSAVDLEAAELVEELCAAGTNLIADLAGAHGDPDACGALVAAALDEPHGPVILAAALRELFGVLVTTDPSRPGTYRA